MNYSKPFYILKISSLHCGYELMVNGCPIDDNLIGEPITIEQPINPWIRNGENVIEIHHLNIKTMSGATGMHENGRLTLELRVKESGQNESVVISKIVYDASKLKRKEGSSLVDFSGQEALFSSIEGSTEQGQYEIVDDQLVPSSSGTLKVGKYEAKEGEAQALMISQTVNIPAPFPEWRFFQADTLKYHFDLTDDEWSKARYELLDVYKPVWEALKADDTEALETLFSLRCAEYDKAYYKQEGQNLYELIVHLKSIIQDDDWALRNLKYEGVDVCVSNNLKMSWLHSWDLPLVSSLAFNHTSADLEKIIPIFFSKFDDKWEIVR